MYSSEAGVPEVRFFAEEVARLSEGAVRIRIVNGWTRTGDRDEERTLLTDLAAGLADLAWVGTRAIGATFGVRALDPLQAPFLFDGIETVSRMLTGEVSSELVQHVERTGLVGLVVLPDAMRRPLGLTRPLVTTSDWRGAVIRVHTSLVEEKTVRTLGAQPVSRHADELRGPRPVGIDGMDLHAGAIAQWGYTGYLTWNVPLWPRTLLLAANRTSLQGLGRDLRTLLDRAAQSTRAWVASGIAGADERERRAVPTGTQLLAATRNELTELRRAVEPVHDDLSHDSVAAAVLERLTSGAARETR
jgi:TRAP-type C4-dicarboxylate transport system substrate-binding protein